MGWRDVLDVPGLPAIFLASALSTWGDYVARLAIAAVVFTWTQSPLATATTLAVSLLPTIFGRSLLSPLVDHLHYRTVLVLSAVSRAVVLVFLVWAVVATESISLLFVLLFLLELLGGPAAAASQVMWTERIPDRHLFVRVMGLSALSEQANQALGFALGGVLIGLLGVRNGLLLDIVTFGVLAVVLTVVVKDERGGEPPPRVRLLDDLRAGAGLITGNPVLTRLLALSVLSTLAISAPEAIAIPYAGGGRLGGLLMSAPIAGAVVGIIVVSRWSPAVQNSRIITMALLMPIPLLGSAFQPGIGLTWALWFASGVLQAFMLPLQSTFALVTPRARRGTIIGLAGSVSVTAAGVSYLVSGWLTEHTTPYAAVTICAIVCLGGVVLIAATWPRRRLAEAVATAYAG